MDKYTKEELEQARILSYENSVDADTEIGFEHCGQWVTNPFVEPTGRFEFTDLDAMCKCYGEKSVYDFLQKILA